MTLRDKLTKLAHDVPEIRKHLIPLLRQGAAGNLPQWKQDLLIELSTARVDKKLSKAQAADLRKTIMDGSTHRTTEQAFKKSLSKMASGVNLLISTQGGFSMRTVPKDAYGQVYDAVLIMGPPTAKALAAKIAVQYKKQIEQMRLSDAQDFIEAKIGEMSRRPMRVRWHFYSMPD